MIMLIGICGGTGSGKTTMARSVVERIGADKVNRIEQDSYYKNLSMISLDERRKANFDHPDSLDINQLAADISCLQRGEKVEVPVYDFATHTRQSETMSLYPKPVTILEGILILSIPELRELMDIKIFLDTSSDTRLLRRIRRDIKERGRTLEQTLNQYETTIRPMHHQFVEPAKEYADIVVPEEGQGAILVEMLSAHVANTLSKTATTL